jgi:hypothetical protein
MEAWTESAIGSGILRGSYVQHKKQEFQSMMTITQYEFPHQNTRCESTAILSPWIPYFHGHEGTHAEGLRQIE